MELPLKISIAFSKCVDTKSFYECLLAIPGSATAVAEGLISQEENQQPSLEGLRRNGFYGLDAQLLTKLVVICFKLAGEKMLLEGGRAIDWSISDASPLLTKQFGATDAASIAFAMGSLTTSAETTQDICVVRID